MWKKEDSGISSLRVAMNSRFKDLVDKIDVTKPKLKYLDYDIKLLQYQFFAFVLQII